MIVDASALIALIHREPGWERLVEALDAAPYAAVAAPTLAEAMIVLAARDVDRKSTRLNSSHYS